MACIITITRIIIIMKLIYKQFKQTGLLDSMFYEDDDDNNNNNNNNNN